MTKKARWISVVVGTAVVAGGLYLAQRSSANPPALGDGVRFTVEPKDLVIEVVDTGKVQPKERVEVKSKIAGQVLEVLVAEGARVKRGDLLLRLDPTDHARDVARAEAEVAQAKNGLELAELTLARKQRGLEGRGVAEVDVDLAKNDVKARAVAVRSAEVVLATAQDRLRYSRITSPIDGTVMELGIKPGEVVTPGVQQTFEGRPLLTLGDLSTLLVRSELNQIDVAKIALGQAVTLTLDALPGRTFSARVTKIAPSAVKPKGKEIDVFPVEATLDVADPAIKPGMTADVRYRVSVKPRVLAVPIEAVLKEDGKTFVTRLVMAEGAEKKEKLEVTLGARNDRELELTSGVSEGEVLWVSPGSAAANEVVL